MILEVKMEMFVLLNEKQIFHEYSNYTTLILNSISSAYLTKTSIMTQ